MGLPPRPSGRQPNTKMLHTMKTPHFARRSENGEKTEIDNELALHCSEDD